MKSKSKCNHIELGCFLGSPPPPGALTVRHYLLDFHLKVVIPCVMPTIVPSEQEPKGSSVKGLFWRMCACSGFWYHCSVSCFLFRFGGSLVTFFVSSFQFGGPGNIRQNHPFGNHLFANPQETCGFSLSGRLRFGECSLWLR